VQLKRLYEVVRLIYYFLNTGEEGHAHITETEKTVKVKAILKKAHLL
jgi:hypothetical protein